MPRVCNNLGFHITYYCLHVLSILVAMECFSPGWKQLAESGFDELSNRHRGKTFSTKTNTLLWCTCIYKIVVNQTSDSAAT